MNSPDWPAIRAHYEASKSTFREVAARFAVPIDTLKKRSAREKWHRSQDGGTNTVAPEPENGTGSGTTNGTNLEIGATNGTGAMAPGVDNGTDDGTEAESSAKNGTVEMAPGVGDGTRNGTNSESGVTIGTAGTENGTTNGTSDGNGTTDGTRGKSGAKNGTKGGINGKMAPVIPAGINSLDRLEAAHFYHGTLGWAVHPLQSPAKGDDNERGKKPVLKGWRNHAAFEITAEDIHRWFGPGSSHNLGCVVRPPYVHVDLDSKPDAGESVRAWLDGRPELAAVPRERTGGGAHLVFRCEDVPESVLVHKKSLSSKINEAVGAELYFHGTNIVLSPSIHKNGTLYKWEVTGDIPLVSWRDLQDWFGFAEPEEQRKAGRPAKEKAWWGRWKEDLRTLDLPGMMQELGMLGECLDPDEGKWAVKCPWESCHSKLVAGEPGSDTAVFSKPEMLPGFRCLHAHCDQRGAKDLLEWAEKKSPGVVGKHCSEMRVWEPGSKTKDGRPKIILPATGRPHGEFATQIGQAAAPAMELFRFGPDIVAIREIRAADENGAIPGHMICPLKPADFVTAIERSVETGVLKEDEAKETVFVPKSMPEADARVTLSSQFLFECLPGITRILDVPVPMLDKDGKLIFPAPGYDHRFRTWLNPDAPRLRTMGLDEAVALLWNDMLAPGEEGGFCWDSPQDRVHALARMITPFCRGLMGWRRTPLWIYEGNREGCGKDTCADSTHYLYTGRSVISAPLSKDCDEEMRKRITAALLSGARFFHLANMKGHIRYSALEAATDNSGVWEDRRLGQSENLLLPNETEFSFSANNATWEPDIERRCRRIRLHFMAEDVNARKFKHADLRGWIRRNRAELLSAVASLVFNWVREGQPHGPDPFASFPEWAHVVGGVIHAAGLGDCCLPHADTNSSGDQNTMAMRRFFVAACAEFGGEWVEKETLFNWIVANNEIQEIFEWLDFSNKRGHMSLGRLLAKYDRREFNGVQLHIRRTSKNYCKYRFFVTKGDLIPTSPTNPPDESEDTGNSSSSVGLQGLEGLFTRTHREGNNSEEKGEVNNYDPYRAVGEKSQKPLKSHCPIICTSRTEFPRIASAITAADVVALDIETYGERKGDGLDPWRGDIRLLSLKVPEQPTWIIDLRATGYDPGELAPALAEAKVIVHNAKFDLLWLRVKCGLVVRRVFCTLTAARALANGTKPGNNLDQCLERYLGLATAADHSTSDWGSMLLTDDQLAYAARDVEHLHDLMAAQEKAVKTAKLEMTLALENDLLPVVIGMEYAGIAVDRDKLAAIRDASRKAAADATASLRAALGMPGLNPGSPAQILAAFRGAGIKLESTNEEALKAADDGKLVPLLLAHREAEKRAQQAQALLDAVKADGRIHARFEPMGTATGRFSSKEPNLQNIGRGEMREAFIAPPGRKLIVADYSQIELRAAAVLAGETKMIDAYKAGADLHRLTAATVLGKPESEVTKEDRQLSKAVNFGLIYGQSAPGLVRYAAASYGVTMERDQAQAIRDVFFRTYTRLRQWHGKSHQLAEQGVKEVRTRIGRRRIIPDTATEWERFTALVNTPVQGGTADGMKLAIIRVAKDLPEGARIVSTVHDELIVECPEASAEDCLRVVKDNMTNSMAALLREVPVEVEAGICQTWKEK